jgi:hypothetical protein
MGDDDRLCEMFENFFRNAAEHGGKSVTVWVTSCEMASTSSIKTGDSKNKGSFCVLCYSPKYLVGLIIFACDCGCEFPSAVGQVLLLMLILILFHWD